MASVFLGRLPGMAGFEKLVAIKVIHPHLADEDEFVGMFLDEARLSAKIHHQNVAETFEVGEDGGLYYMVGELVRGRNLKELMAAATREAIRLQPRLYLSIIAKLCDALHCAHTLKDYDGTPLCLVHRDVSPSNIMLSFDGDVKLIDFGIASARKRITATRSGVIKGKTGYMAPELLNGEPADSRTDIFSLGVVLYLMATGNHPFPGDNEGAQFYRVLSLSPPSPRSIVAEIPLTIEGIIDKALVKDPQHRYQTAHEMGRDVRKSLDSLGGLMDSADIAGLMSRLFAVDIVEEESRFAQAIASRFHSEDRAPSNIGAAEPGTEVLDRPSPPIREPDRKSKKNRVWGFAVGAAAVCVTLVYWFNQGPIAGGLLTDPERGEARLDAEPPATSQKKEPSFPTQAVEPAIKSVEIALKGLPKMATVELDGKEATLKDGKIAVPADGRQRELNVSAPGYLPYSRKIAPAQNGTLTIRMAKKKSPSKNKGYTKPVKDKSKLDDNLMECPYCKK